MGEVMKKNSKVFGSNENFIENYLSSLQKQMKSTTIKITGEQSSGASYGLLAMCCSKLLTEKGI